MGAESKNKQTNFPKRLKASKFLRFLHRDLSYRSQVCLKKIGDPSLQITKKYYPLEITRISIPEKKDFSKEFAENYEKGLSVSEIAIAYGCSKSRVLRALKKAKIQLRAKYAQQTHQANQYRGKAHCKPYFGFCYFEGQLVKHPEEFPTLQLIYLKWSKGISAHYIVTELNKRKIKSRERKEWSWAAINNILKRFKDGTLSMSENTFQITSPTKENI